MIGSIGHKTRPAHHRIAEIDQTTEKAASCQPASQLDQGFRGLLPILEPVAVIAGFDYVATVGEPSEQRRRHLGIAKVVASFPGRRFWSRSARRARMLADQV